MMLAGVTRTSIRCASKKAFSCYVQLNNCRMRARQVIILNASF